MARTSSHTEATAPLCSRRNQIIAVTVVLCIFLLSVANGNDEKRDGPNAATINKLRNREKDLVASHFTTTVRGKHQGVDDSSQKKPQTSTGSLDAASDAKKMVFATHKSDGTSWPSVNLEILEGTGKRFPMTPPVPAAYKDPPVELKGQITLQTTFGAKLHELARQDDVRLVLEIGTWFGGGSSWCIAQGLRDTLTDREKPDKWMFTVEMFQPAHDYAAATLANLPVSCIRAGTVGKAGYLKPEEIPDNEKNEHYNLYYDRDIQLADTAPATLETICKTYDFDLVLLDGNEYTGYAEFAIVRDACKPKYLALHDCGTLKTRKVQAYLDGEGSTHWKKIAANSDAAAWAIYQAI